MKHKSPVEYLKFTAQKNIDICYNYFIKQEIPNNWKGKVCFPKDSATLDGSCSPEEKLVFVASCIDLSFGSGLFQKVETTLDGPEIAMQAISPLPSLFLSGKV